VTRLVRTAFCFDLDGTITSRELLPAIASELGLSEEMALLTSLTIRGLIPFESSFRLRCGILRQIPVSRVREIVADIPLDPVLEAFIRQNHERCAVVTGNLDIWVKDMVAGLDCAWFSSRGTVASDWLESVSSVLSKDQAVKTLRAQGFDRVVAIGDGFNDLPMFEAADIGVAFGGVHPPVSEVIQLARYVVFRSASLCRLLNTL
jgi:HAD superfamily phosphoserine phosphatase-like hydrolase